MFTNIKCPKCERANNFVSEVVEVRDYNFKLSAIKCGSCNTVVSFLEYYNNGALLQKIIKFLKIR
ncbi:hypothetical protein [Winogradskyella luteola]|uniref:Uncharacterized protein n=1 Tax=Winogradskyella luteola TaxID=2828330 RepID=A0A9X1F6M4_9FLAO|nr:hypothetical protein [Winogradskyella luteola]MBV7268114.1 hypothetical protein [Winogradskyella luteola]